MQQIFMWLYYVPLYFIQNGNFWSIVFLRFERGYKYQKIFRVCTFCIHFTCSKELGGGGVPRVSNCLNWAQNNKRIHFMCNNDSKPIPEKDPGCANHKLLFRTLKFNLTMLECERNFTMLAFKNTSLSWWSIQTTTFFLTFVFQRTLSFSFWVKNKEPYVFLHVLVFRAAERKDIFVE